MSYDLMEVGSYRCYRHTTRRDIDRVVTGHNVDSNLPDKMSPRRREESTAQVKEFREKFGV